MQTSVRRENFKIKQIACKGEARQGQQQQGRAQGGGNQRNREGQGPHQHRGEVAEHRPHAGAHRGHQRRAVVEQQRDRECRHAEHDEGQHCAHQAGEGMETQHLGGRRHIATDHEAVNRCRVGQPDHQKQGAYRRHHPQAAGRLAEAGQRVGQAGTTPGAISPAQAEEAGQHGGPDEQEAAGERQHHRRQAEAPQQPVDQQPQRGKHPCQRDGRLQAMAQAAPTLADGGKHGGDGNPARVEVGGHGTTPIGKAHISPQPPASVHDRDQAPARA